ncbi:hypothetical protein ACFS7Z_20960 [Pontibacter toksunensis]|uniref:Uncharacterized protein n=1 Tax=Pontibacter toksunensis TaxID=1332631 RepID=A0ABW6C0G1_9BACT
MTVTWKGGVTRENVRRVRGWLLLRENPCPLMLNDMQGLIIVLSCRDIGCSNRPAKRGNDEFVEPPQAPAPAACMASLIAISQIKIIYNI